MGFRNSEETKREQDGIVYFVRKNMNLNDIEFERFAIQTHFIEQNESYINVIKNKQEFFERMVIL